MNILYHDGQYFTGWKPSGPGYVPGWGSASQAEQFSPGREAGVQERLEREFSIQATAVPVPQDVMMRQLGQRGLFDD